MSKRANQNYSPAVRGFTKVVLPLPIRSAMKRDWHGQENIPREGGVIVAVAARRTSRLSGWSA